MSDKREKDLEKARQYLVAIENEGKSLPEILIGFAEKETTSQQQTIERLREMTKKLSDRLQNYGQVWGYDEQKLVGEAKKLFNTTEPIDQ